MLLSDKICETLVSVSSNWCLLVTNFAYKKETIFFTYLREEYDAAVWLAGEQFLQINDHLHQLCAVLLDQLGQLGKFLKIVRFSCNCKFALATNHFVSIGKRSHFLCDLQHLFMVLETFLGLDQLLSSVLQHRQRNCLLEQVHLIVVKSLRACE